MPEIIRKQQDRVDRLEKNSKKIRKPNKSAQKQNNKNRRKDLRSFEEDVAKTKLDHTRYRRKNSYAETAKKIPFISEIIRKQQDRVDRLKENLKKRQETT